MWMRNISFDSEDKLIELRNSSFRIIIWIIVLLPLLLITKAIINNNSDNNKYSSYEQKMVVKTKDYIHNNTFEIEENSSAYIDLYTLGMDLDKSLNCSKSSGVIVSYDGEQFQYDPYLICKDYESTIKNLSNNKQNDDYITLNGLNPMIINGEYEEPGYVVDSKYWVDVSDNISSAPGLYVVNYNVYEGDNLKANVKRIVIIGDYTEEDKINNPNPTITLLGDSNMSVMKGSFYTDPGYKAADSNGDLTDKVKVYGTVDTSTVGDYYITYYVANSNGKIDKKIRIVTVAEDQTNQINIQLTAAKNSNKGFTITANITGDNYYYTVLPNYSRNYSRVISYDVYNNGTYEFAAYDKNYHFTKASITINNIDKTGPTATCINKIENNKSIITVSASDNGSGIAGYSYSNGTSGYTNYIKDSTYTFDSSNRNAFVKVKDNDGNITSITCSVTGNTSTVEQTNVTFDMSPVKNKTEMIKCNTDPTIYNEALRAKVNAAGIKTRWAVVQAAANQINLVLIQNGDVISLSQAQEPKDNQVEQYGHLDLIVQDL